MQRRWQHHGWLLAVLVLGACATDGTGQEDVGEQSDPESVSGLSLALTSVDSQGRSYRLRNAMFSISRDSYGYYDGGTLPPPTQISTEADPSAERLTVRLLPGGYRVALLGEWYLERLGPNGPERIEQAALLSDPVQYAYIGNGWNYDLDFRFGVDGSLIDFRHGDLNIDISIELPGEGPIYPSYDAGIYHSYDAGSSYPSYDAGVRPDAESVLPF